MSAQRDDVHAADTEVPDDPRLMEAVQEYMRRTEAGERPSRQEFMRRYPDLAEPLAQCLDGLDLVHKAAAPGAGFRAGLPPIGDAMPADPLGDFQIVREIGRGGMGIVYEAMQLSLGRRVALKVLPFAAALDAKHLQRFKTEAHAAAQLHHTNIVPIYAVGCERGVHFYAMQLIEGRTLDEVIDALREEAKPGSFTAEAGMVEHKSTPSNPTLDVRVRATVTAPGSGRTTYRSGRARESFRTAAKVIAQVADALEYAHDAGVVHRDVKPANLLLDAKGGVWITDFGLAHVAADVGLTQTGDLVGTLRYMSPEQAAGQRVLVDHRTDVYSLGATLYEWLTLEPIFPGQDRQKLLHQILHEEPRPLRYLDRSIPFELETIVLKAVAKTPSERYATAGDMAADLRRFLEEKPILARRPSLIDRTRKWMRRHPSYVGAAVLLLVFGIIALATTTVLVSHEQALTDAAYKKERQRAEEAEQRLQLAIGVADDMIQLAESELADQPHLEGLRKRMLESALAYYQKFIEQREGDPNAQEALAETRDKVKRIVDDLTVLQGAGQYFLLRDKGVLADLEVKDDQRQKLAEWSKRLDEKQPKVFRDFHLLKPSERTERFAEVARENEATIKTILSDKQRLRLEQIALQAKGPAAFRDPEIARKVKLTAEQKEKIRAIEMGHYFMRLEVAKGEPFKGEPFKGEPFKGEPPKADPSKGFKAFEQNRKAALTQIQALLTMEQTERWAEMTGERFRGPMPPMFFGARGLGKKDFSKGGPGGPMGP